MTYNVKILEKRAFYALIQNPSGPYGAKGVGECGMVLLAAAIGNAVYNATGIRFNEIPLTPERVYKKLQENKK